jgi:hypothetical protein
MTSNVALSPKHIPWASWATHISYRITSGHIRQVRTRYYICIFPFTSGQIFSFITSYIILYLFQLLPIFPSCILLPVASIPLCSNNKFQKRPNKNKKQTKRDDNSKNIPFPIYTSHFVTPPLGLLSTLGLLYSSIAFLMYLPASLLSSSIAFSSSLILMHKETAAHLFARTDR